MHPEDRYILTNMVSFVDITHDIYFACEEGWITSSDLVEVQEESESQNKSYQDVLLERFEHWYMEKACPEQQFLVDLNGFISLNDQFDDIQTIIAKDIEDHLLKDFRKPEVDTNSFEYQIQQMLGEEKTGIFNKLSSPEQSPIKTRKDLCDLPNMVYLLNHSKKDDWAKSVNSILFRLKHNSYNGLSIEEAFDWLIHSRNLKAIEFKKSLEKIYAENETDEIYYDVEKEEEEKNSFLGFVLKLKKNKEEGYAKKAIKRGLKTLSSILSPREVSLFTSGDGFIVESKLFNYRIRKSGVSMIKQTLNPIGCHIPYDLIVMSKENVELCNLCIYFDETPVIDQVIATVMHLQFEEGEQKMLETGNFFNKKEAFYSDATMMDYLGEKGVYHYSRLEAENLTESESNMIEEDSYHDEIKQAVFDALPNFIGAKLPELVYSDFHNLVFDDILSTYQMAETDAEKIVSPLIYQALESI